MQEESRDTYSDSDGPARHWSSAFGSRLACLPDGHEPWNTGDERKDKARSPRPTRHR